MNPPPSLGLFSKPASCRDASERSQVWPSGAGCHAAVAALLDLQLDGQRSSCFVVASDAFLLSAGVPGGESAQWANAFVRLLSKDVTLMFSSRSKEGKSRRKAEQQAVDNLRCYNRSQGPSVFPAFYILSLLLVPYEEFAQSQFISQEKHRRQEFIVGVGGASVIEIAVWKEAQ